MTVHHQTDYSELPAKKKKTFETNIFEFFRKRAPISNFCCATNQNNPHIKYVSCDRPHLLKPFWKIRLVGTPHTLLKFLPLSPPQLLGISISYPWGGGGYGYFLESHNSLHFPSPSRVCRCCNSCSKINMFFHSYHHTT